MIVIGLVLLLVVIAGSVIVVSEGGDSVHVHLHWLTVHANGSALFVAGAVALLVAMLGLGLIRVGVRGARRRRREIKDLRQRAAASQRPAPSTPTKTAKQQEPPPHRPPRSPDADDYFDSAPRD